MGPAGGLLIPIVVVPAVLVVVVATPDTLLLLLAFPLLLSIVAKGVFCRVIDCARLGFDCVLVELLNFNEPVLVPKVIPVDGVTVVVPAALVGVAWG